MLNFSVRARAAIALATALLVAVPGGAAAAEVASSAAVMTADPTAPPSPSAEGTAPEPEPTEPATSDSTVPVTPDPDPSSDPAPVPSLAPTDAPSDTSMSAPDGKSDELDPAPEFETVALDRLAGADQIGSAVAASQAARAPGVPRVYLGNISVFADALSAAAAAAEVGGSLLWTSPTALDPRVAAEIDRLQPDEVVILGGAAGVSAAVETAVASLGHPTRRIAANDRYGVSRAVVAESYGRDASVVLVSGRVMSDALAASAAAAAWGVPVLVIDSSAAAIDESTLALIREKGATTVHLVGSTAAMPTRFDTQLSGLGFTVIHSSGADHAQTSISIATRAFPTAGRVALVSKAGFASGMSAVAYAAGLAAPMYFAEQSCVDPAVRADIVDRLGGAPVTLLGEPAVLADQLLGLPECFDAVADRLALTQKLTSIITRLPGVHSVTVQVLEGHERSVAIGGKTTREPASVIKLFAAYVTLLNVDQGRISLATRTRSGVSVGECLRVMIQASDNLCHADLLALFGNSAINRQLFQSGFTSTWYVGYDGRGIYRSAKRTTTNDVNRLLVLLYKRQLLTPASTDLLLTHLDDQLWRSRIPSGVEHRTPVSNKVGELWVSTGMVQGDAGIVYAAGEPFAISIIGERNSTREAIRAIAQTAFEHLEQPLDIRGNFSDYNIVTSVPTPMYSGAGTGYLGTLPAGIALRTESSNRVWYRVWYGGRYFFVRHNYTYPVY